MPKISTEKLTGKRYPLNMRTTQEVRSKLESAAKASGRSLAQEVESRLDRSFERQGLLSEVMELAYGSHLAATLMHLGRAMARTGRHCGFMKNRTIEAADNWFLDPYAFDQAVQAANWFLEGVRPPGDVALPKVLAAETQGVGMLPEEAADEINSIYARLGESSASTELLTIIGELDSMDQERLGETTRKMFPPETLNLIKKRQKPPAKKRKSK